MGSSFGLFPFAAALAFLFAIIAANASSVGLTKPPAPGGAAEPGGGGGGGGAKPAGGGGGGGGILIAFFLFLFQKVSNTFCGFLLFKRTIIVIYSQKKYWSVI